MKITCYKCNTIYNIRKDKIPEVGVVTKCKKCGTEIEIMPPTVEVKPKEVVLEKELEEIHSTGKARPKEVELEEELEEIPSDDLEEIRSPEGIVDKKKLYGTGTWEGGLLGTIWERWGRILFEPDRFFESMEPEIGYGTAFFYGILMMSLGIIIKGLLILALPIFFYQSLPFNPDVTKNAIFHVSAIAFVPFYLVISSAFSHLFVLIRKGKGKFNYTFKVVVYCDSSVWLFLAMPYAGYLIFLVWLYIIKTRGFRTIQGLSTEDAVLATIVPMFLPIISIILLDFILPPSLI